MGYFAVPDPFEAPMIATENTQSIAEFRESAAATIERLNQTGEPEFITVDGEARAVILAPAVYERLAEAHQLSQDVEAIRQSERQIAAGDYMEAGAFFDQLRNKLLVMKAAQASAAAAGE
jgi:PHD/YefM family antitoxin component YafN of YafNO toxin-antitoxin module